MKFLTTAVLFFSVFSFSAASFSEIVSTADSINKAGAQRMLSQRIVKNYIMIGNNIKATQAHEELDQAIALFEQQHLELLDFVEDPSVIKALDNVSETWGAFRIKAISNPTKETAKELISLSDTLFIKSNKVVSVLENKANTKSATLVNTSGKQRMLSQKIAKLYMAMAWQIDKENLTIDFDNALKEYEKGLAQLNAAQENTPAINKKLNKVNAQWKFSKAGFSQYKEDRFVPTLISVTTESILKKMDELTADYQQLAENS